MRKFLSFYFATMDHIYWSAVHPVGGDGVKVVNVGYCYFSQLGASLYQSTLKSGATSIINKSIGTILMKDYNIRFCTNACLSNLQIKGMQNNFEPFLNTNCAACVNSRKKLCIPLEPL